MNEEKLIKNMISMLKEKSKKDYSLKNTKRDAHSKSLGLLKGYFKVEANLPNELQLGVFEEAKTYKTLIRISNASPKVSSDKKKDFRGFAIKLLGVKGAKVLNDEKNTQDFLLMNNKTMPLGTVELFHDAIYYTTKSNPILFAGKLLIRRKLKIIPEMIKNRKHDTSPLDIKYYSTTPYLYFNKAVKYALIPKSNYKSKLPKKLTDNYLSDNMQKHLEQEDAIFDFMVQFQQDKKKMPTEDASVLWNEKDAPFIKVAELVIPKQTIKTKERDDMAEVLSFSPGHSLKEHKPIGGINRARIKIYEAMSEFRHKRNGKALFEPTEKDFDKLI